MSVETNMEIPLESAYIIPALREAEPETFPHLVGVEIETVEPEDTSESELLAKAREGDTDAYALLFDRHRGLLRKTVGMGLHNKAEEIVQDAFIRTSTRLHMYEDRGLGIESWLKRVTINLTRDEFKKPRVDESYELDEARDTAVERNIEDQVLARIELQKVWASLTPLHRDIVQSIYLNDESHEECAARLGMTRRQVRLHLYEMRANLRELREQGKFAA